MARPKECISLSKYVWNQNSTGGTRNLLIAAPLSVITVFCFGFVLLQPSPDLKKGVVASNGTEGTAIEAPSAQLPALSMAEQSSLSKLSTVPVVAASTQPNVPVSTANPQSQPLGNLLSNLQSALPATTLSNSGNNDKKNTAKRITNKNKRHN